MRVDGRVMATAIFGGGVASAVIGLSGVAPASFEVDFRALEAAAVIS